MSIEVIDLSLEQYKSLNRTTEGTLRSIAGESLTCLAYYAAEEIKALRVRIKAITHCANCGCNWLDDGLNPAWCPYCKKEELVNAQ